MTDENALLDEDKYSFTVKHHYASADYIESVLTTCLAQSCTEHHMKNLDPITIAGLYTDLCLMS